MLQNNIKAYPWRNKRRKETSALKILCLTFALYFYEWIKVCARVSVYMFQYLVIKRWELGVFLRSCLENKLKLHYARIDVQGRMAWGEWGSLRVVPCAEAHEAVAEVCILQFFILFRAFFHLEMPWYLGWISPTCFVLVLM